MYSGHIIIQGCQPGPFERNKYPELYTFRGLNFVWTHSCYECHSQSFIQLATFRSSVHWDQAILYKWQELTLKHTKVWFPKKMPRHPQRWDLIPGLFRGLKLITARGENYTSRMMDDKLNLCPGTEGERWQRYLSWEWRLGSGKAGCLKAQDIDKFIQWTPLLGPFLCFESWPLAKWPTSLMLPAREECMRHAGRPTSAEACCSFFCEAPKIIDSFWTMFVWGFQEMLDSGSLG